MKIVKSIRLMSLATAATLAVFASFAETSASEKSATAVNAAAKAETGKKYVPLAEARSKIESIIADPALMTDVMKTLSSEDQKAFLSEVNAAISKLPGSTEDKTAKYLNVNRAALKGAEAGEGMQNVLAVVFATVPPESLTVLSERYAVDLFNRDADPSHKISDAVFEKTAQEVVGKVEQTTAGSDDAGVRNTLAILMFVRASNGSPENLADTLVETMPDATTRELAKKEWIPAARAEGENKSYDAMLAYADAGKQPNLDIVLSLAGPQILDAELVDIISGVNNSIGIQTTPVLDQAFGGFDEARIYINDDTTSATATLNGGGVVPRTPPGVTPEPKPYPFSNM